jgi:hypothetical protein
MNAWMSPTESCPEETRRPPMTAMARKLRLPRNIIAGCTHPEMNCAPNVESKSSSFSSSNVRCISSCMPNTRTRLWPVNASSICALRVPV